MLSYHASGLAVVAAPNRPAEMRSFDPLVVTRLLDLVSSHFDYVVFDMPRTWFSWTDNVLLGSNRSSSSARRRCRVCAGRDSWSKPSVSGSASNPTHQVIVNRFEQKLFSPGLRRADIERAIGGSLAAFIPNNYGLVREAIDRGVPLNEVKPGNAITAQLKKFIVAPVTNPANAGATPAKDSGLRAAGLRRRRGKPSAPLRCRDSQWPAVSHFPPRCRLRSSRRRLTASRRARARGEAQPEIVEAAPEPVGNPLLTEKLLDAKVRLSHRRLIEEINLSALEKLPEEEIRGHVQQLVSQYVLVERLALNAQELNNFISRNSRRNARSSGAPGRC